MCTPAMDGVDGVIDSRTHTTRSAYKPPRYVPPRDPSDDDQDEEACPKLTGKKARRAVRRQKIKSKKRKSVKIVENVVKEKDLMCDNSEIDDKGEWPNIDGAAKATDELGFGNPLNKEPKNICPATDIK